MICSLVVGAARAAEDAPDDAFKSKGLVKAGATYVLPAEQELNDAMRSIRIAKKKMDEDTKVRNDIETRIRNVKGMMGQWEFQRRSLDAKLAQTTDATTRELIERLLARIDTLEKRVAQLENPRHDIAAPAVPVFQVSSLVGGLARLGWTRIGSPGIFG